MIRSGLYTKNQMSILLERLASRTQIMDLGIIETCAYLEIMKHVDKNS